jgi:hypothetical protein
MVCAGANTPYQRKEHASYVMGARGQADMVMKTSERAWITMPLPRDLCQREGPSAESMGEPGKDWTLAVFARLVA